MQRTTVLAIVPLLALPLALLSPPAAFAAGPEGPPMTSTSTAAPEPEDDESVTVADLFGAEAASSYFCSASTACVGGYPTVSCTGFGPDSCRTMPGCWVRCNNQVVVCPDPDPSCPHWSAFDP